MICFNCERSVDLSKTAKKVPCGNHCSTVNFFVCGHCNRLTIEVICWTMDWLDNFQMVNCDNSDAFLAPENYVLR